MQNSHVVLILPGTWSSHAEFAAALNERVPDYHLAQNTLIDGLTQSAVHFTFQPGRRAALVDDFRCCGERWRHTSDMRAVAQHRSRIILTDAGGSRRRMAQLMAAASVVIKAGALGVLVKKVCIAHAPRAWLALQDDGVDGIFRAFVVTVEGAAMGTYSCGMTCFGLKEVSVSSEVPNGAAVVGTLTRHLLVKGARLRTGQTISVGGRASRYCVSDVKATTAPDGSVIPNPLGTWQLIPANTLH